MSMVILGARIGRWLALLLLGVVLGTGLVGSVSAAIGADVESATTIYTRTMSCPGLGFSPINSAIGYSTYSTLRSGDGYFTCALGLPNKAVVTRVRFTLRDNVEPDDVANCALVRIGQTVATAETVEVLATVPATFDYPGIVRLTTTAIAHATIDNTKWAYYLQCQIGDKIEYLGIYGADVTYTISGANG